MAQKLVKLLFLFSANSSETEIVGGTPLLQKSTWPESVNTTAVWSYTHSWGSLLWWPLMTPTRRHYPTTQAKHTHQFTATRETIQCTARFNASKIYKVTLSTYFYCTSVIKYYCYNYSRSELLKLPPYSLLVLQCKSGEHEHYSPATKQHLTCNYTHFYSQF